MNGKMKTKIARLGFEKGTVVTIATNKEGEVIKGKTGMVLCNGANGSLFFHEHELEEV